MTKFEIKKNIPLPEAEPKGVGPKYPFSEMEIGDCFYVPATVQNARKLRASLSSCISHHSKRHGGKFSARNVEQDGAVFVGVWRVE